jgi:4'-phosphopantetheinyl transferase
MYLFLYEGENKNTDVLVRHAYEMYADENGRDIPDEIMIGRTENGKPYFENIPDVHFSVSHTGMMWVCLMADFNVGIDIQEQRPVKSKAIADRYFGPAEEHYVALWGDEGFTDLWVRKEAAVKFEGTTLARGIGTEVAYDGDLLPAIKIGGADVVLEGVDMGPYVKCAYAAEKKEDICIRMLMI